jgi:hypothetical protein
MRSRFIYLLAFTGLLLLTGRMAAQPDDASKHEKIEALRVSFITQKVNFTPQEAQAFWPLYNEMNDKLNAARKTFRQQYNKDTNYNFATDKEAEAYVNAGLILKQKEYEIPKEYYDKYKKILPIKKVAALKRAEEEFKRELIKSIKGNPPSQPE